MMRRRAFLTLLGGTVAGSSVTRPFAVRAQTMPVIGVLSSASSRDYGPMIATFKKNLGEAGYVDGQNVKIEYLWADEQYDRLPALAAELVRRQVSLILAATTPAAIALKPATQTIPVVFAIGCDPVQTGLVGSLSRPGGNFTGAAHVNVETAPKRLELVHELIPAEKIVGILLNPTNPVAQSVATAVQPAAGSLGLELKVFYAHSDEEIDRVFASLAEIKIRRPGDRDRSVLHQPGRASAPYRSVRRCPPFINIASSSRPAAS